MRFYLRVNETYPSFFHAHPVGALTFSFAQGGTIFQSGDIEGSGEEYSLKAGQLGIFDKKIWHKAADFSKDWVNHPRVNLVVGPG